MLINAKTTISTSKVLLVPYSEYHVARYHEWMQDKDIQSATASEPLTLTEEFSMQKSWQSDPDKLTFIVCEPFPIDLNIEHARFTKPYDALRGNPTKMLGDVNLFLSTSNSEEAPSPDTPSIVGELELMIAEKSQHRKGYGRAALLVFLAYILRHEQQITTTFLHGHASTVASTGNEASSQSKFEFLRAKIGKDNHRSLALFESLGFIRVGDEPNFFGEWELRRDGLSVGDVEEMMSRWEITGWREL